jgi:hypothetical protein
LTKASYGIEDLVCGFLPDEWLWVPVLLLDEFSDGGFQFFGRAMNAMAELFLRQQRKPSFDQVQPTG